MPFKHRCKKKFFTSFIILIKNMFLRFFIFECFLFSSAKIFNPSKAAKLYIEQLLSDVFNMGATGNSLNEEP